MRQKRTAYGHRESRIAVSAVARRAYGLAGQGRSLIRRRAGGSRRPVSGGFATSLAVDAQFSGRFQTDDVAISGRAEYGAGMEEEREETEAQAGFAFDFRCCRTRRF